MSDTKRLGFACKWIDHPNQTDGIKPTDACKKYNTGTTTISWLNRQTKDRAVEKLWSLMKENIEATRKLVEKVGTLDANLRMVRLSSDLLPAYTECNWSWFWREHDVISYAERHFGQIGELARGRDVRLSFHPGQFTVLASDNPGIVERSIEEFEYHVDMARWMGYGKQFQDFKINVHISGRQGPQGIRAALTRLTPEARNCITLENEETSWGLEDCLSLADVVPTVLDIHHHWIKTGEYIEANDSRISSVIDSWRGRRPVIHYSVSREEQLPDACRFSRPSLTTLLESGKHNKQKLRAHSDFTWNNAVNDWALSHWQWADIMVEAKGKNLATQQLFDYARQRQSIQDSI